LRQEDLSLGFWRGLSAKVEFCALFLLPFLVGVVLCGGCAHRAGPRPAVVAAARVEEPVTTASTVAPDRSEEVFAVTQEYFQNTYRKAQGFYKTAEDLYQTGLVREAVPYLDTALLTILDSQIELGEFPRMRALYDRILELDSRIIESNPEALDIYVENRWSHFNSKNYSVPIVLNNSVRFFIQEYRTAGREFMARSLKRSGRYLPMIKEMFSRAGLPEDLAYLVIIESGFSPTATSYAGARGLWQFMPSTARRYGLVMNYWVDERCDPEKSTRAAIRYLKDLYSQLKSWKLVLAAYNGGENRVRRVVSRSGTRDFWELASLDGLHRQTKEYVPRFMAATIIAKYPEKFGFYVNYDDPVEYDRVTIRGWVDLKAVAECCGTSYRVIRQLNPELRRWCTPPIYSRYALKIPKGTREQFWRRYRRMPRKRRSRIVTHRVRYGETLWSIARRYHSSVRAIMSANGLRSTRIRAGRRLMIPILPRRSKRSRR